MDRGLDYSWGRPDLGEVKRLGYQWVSRYLSYDETGKNVTAGERDAILAQGLELMLNWQWAGSWAELQAGANRGTEHATEAVRQARALAYPQGCTIYYSVDFDATTVQLATVAEYLAAAATITRLAGYRIGVYGGIRTVAYMLDRAVVDDAWQTYAWSAGQWDSRAAIRQVRNGQHIAGAEVDINERHGITYLMGGTPVATERILQHEINRQDNGHYCGPAATRVALTTRGIYVSEPELAKTLKTTTAGTNSIADIIRGLHQHIDPDVYAAVYLPGNDVTPEQAAAFKRNIIASVDAGYGVVVNVVGTGRDINGAAYTYSGGHYVTVVGYRANGDEMLVTDVAIGRDLWMKAAALDTWAAARGYAYAANVPVTPTPAPSAQVGPGAPFPLPAGHYYGLRSGPAESHGGFYANEQPVIEAIQGIVGAVQDGVFGSNTEAAVKVWQRANGLVDDGRVGPVTWSAMFPATPTPTPVPEPPVVVEPEPEPTPEPEPPVETPAPAPSTPDLANVLATLARVEAKVDALAVTHTTETELEVIEDELHAAMRAVLAEVLIAQGQGGAAALATLVSAGGE